MRAGCVSENGCKVTLAGNESRPENNRFKVYKVRGLLGGYTIQCEVGYKYLDGDMSPVDPPSNPLDFTFDLTSKVFVNGCAMHVWQRGNELLPRTNQEWSIEKLPNGNYIIKNLMSGKVLDVPAADANRNGGKVQLWSKRSNDLNQQWIFE